MTSTIKSLKTLPPTQVIIEALGKRTVLGEKPVFGDFACPYTDETCIKQSGKVEEPYYPVCSISPKNKKEVVAICPKRFHARDLVADILKYAWFGDVPTNPKIAYEVKMKGFGTVDFVVADVDEQGVKSFVSCEIQAVDITGSVAGFFVDYVKGEALSSVPNDKIGKRDYSFGFNRKNVAKRYLSQLIYKGHQHQLWGTRIVALVQKSMYDYFQSQASFKTDKNVDDPLSSIVFIVYDYKVNEITKQLDFDVVEVHATSHNALQNGNMYITPPKKEEFEAKIMSRI